MKKCQVEQNDGVQLERCDSSAPSRYEVFPLSAYHGYRSSDSDSGNDDGGGDEAAYSSTLLRTPFVVERFVSF